MAAASSAIAVVRQRSHQVAVVAGFRGPGDQQGGHSINTHDLDCKLLTFGLPRAVWLLSGESCDRCRRSEAIYPLLPFFLTRVLNANAVSLGIVEGGRGGGKQSPQDRVRPDGRSVTVEAATRPVRATVSRRLSGR